MGQLVARFKILLWWFLFLAVGQPCVHWIEKQRQGIYQQMLAYKLNAVEVTRTVRTDFNFFIRNNKELYTDYALLATTTGNFYQ